ncbi:MAG TPA: AtpZ/AtpI family protein [Gemmatimonadales bacterium]|nr:AtpZ/AtpI family protein [Gemmatimonadales bacterium]
MAGPTGPRNPLAQAYRYSGLGCMFAAAVLVMMAGGWLLDRWLGWFPVLTVIGALVGATLGTLSIYRQLISRPRP